MTKSEAFAAVAARIAATPAHLHDLDPLEAAEERERKHASALERRRVLSRERAVKAEAARLARLEAQWAAATAKAVLTRCDCGCGRSWGGRPGRRWFERKCAAKVRRAQERAAVVAGWQEREETMRRAWGGAA